MKRIMVLVALGACEGGQSPSSENIRIAQLACEADESVAELTAELDVTLEVGQAIRVTFLPDLDVQFSRRTSWDCGTWGTLTGDDGCVGDASDASQTVSVIETMGASASPFPPSFAYTVVASITNMDGLDIENVLLDAECP